MRSLTRSALLLGLLSLSFAAACGGNPPEEIAQISSDIQSTCLKPSGDPAAVFPWNASWPIGTQDVYCQNMPNETARSTWPAGISRCTTGVNAGARQVDVWLGDNAAPTNYYCSRVTLPAAPAHFVLDYEPFLEMGWLSTGLTPSRTRIMIGAWVGPGSSVVVESRASANPLGCSVPVSGCASAQVAATGATTWMAVSGFKADAVNFF